MKKFASILMTVAMLASLLVISVSAEQSNMEVTVPKFTTQPTIDGVVTEEEWGTATIHMVTDGAATAEDSEIGYNEEYGLKNIFYWFNFEGFSDALSYDMWVRWDDTNVYVAAVVNDPDPHSQPNSGEGMWSGDNFQFCIDTNGPSSIMKEKGYTDWDYKTEEFNGGRFNKPWSSKSSAMLDATMGLTGGDTPNFYNNKAQEAIDEQYFAINTVPNNDENETCTTTYECAVPWSMVNELLVPKAGDVYGMVAVVCCSDSNELNAWLQWGHGLCSVELNNSQPRGTRGGTQAIILSDDTVTPAAEYAVATSAPETTEPVADETEETEASAGDVAESTEADDAEETKADDEKETTANTTKDSSSNNNKDEGGLSTGAIVGIVVAIVVVAAVVVIIIIKKKKS